ncbi:DNA repair protein RecO [uncultured Bacteroides sp.]|uniref:DNA repair protein RecO n=1 Tax=uncultured Bacteroides sp. TaxID=162156 RepID=UPI002AABD97F|nr:DNA repair protein RecO [uncultured Bacteroides sp.]
MLQKTVGIVLHVLKYNDTSNIVEVYTEQLGRASFLISVSRAKKSSVKASLFQPLAIVEFEFDNRPSLSLHRIKEARTYLPFVSIPYDPYKSAIALFLAEFLYRSIREEIENHSLFAYLCYSISWLDEQKEAFANFHLVFLMRLSRFLGLYPNLEGYEEGDYFDMQNACFVHTQPQQHSFYIEPSDSLRLAKLMRMNYETMHLFSMNRAERTRCLVVINEYYRLHLPDFPVLKSLSILQELFN